MCRCQPMGRLSGFLQESESIYRILGYLQWWFASTLVLWLGAGLALRPSAVISVIVAVICDELRAMTCRLERQKLGPQVLIFSVDLGLILSDLGIVNSEADWEEVVSLQKTLFTFPSLPLQIVQEPPFSSPWLLRKCVWIPEAHTYIWPDMQKFQTNLAFSETILVPSSRLLAECVPCGSECIDQPKKDICEVSFFIGSGRMLLREHYELCFEYGLSVPSSFAKARLRAGGFGTSCMEAKENQPAGRHELILGRFPYHFVPPKDISTCCFLPIGRLRREKQLERAWNAFGKYFQSMGWGLDTRSYCFTARQRHLTITVYDTSQYS